MAIDEDPEQHEPDALRVVVPSFSGLRVLEIGCGDGRLTRHYARDAASVIAIDPDAEAVEELARALPSVDARVLGVDAIDLDPHSVDLVLFAWSL
jgi:16S rRNA A1518/A1519 N6-dimethyltransferase RsmA/KsgA/DIM1 with predicted DNA glycosylase/AP lyase activity